MNRKLVKIGALGLAVWVVFYLIAPPVATGVLIGPPFALIIVGIWLPWKRYLGTGLGSQLLFLPVVFAWLIFTTWGIVQIALRL